MLSAVASILRLTDRRKLAYTESTKMSRANWRNGRIGKGIRMPLRCSLGRHYADRESWRRLRHPSGAGYCRRSRGSVAGDDLDGVYANDFRAVFWWAVGPGGPCCISGYGECARARWSQANGAPRLAYPPGRTQALILRIFDGRCDWWLSLWRALARPFSC